MEERKASSYAMKAFMQARQKSCLILCSFCLGSHSWSWQKLVSTEMCEKLLSEDHQFILSPHCSCQQYRACALDVVKPLF